MSYADQGEVRTNVTSDLVTPLLCRDSILPQYLVGLLQQPALTSDATGPDFGLKTAIGSGFSNNANCRRGLYRGSGSLTGVATGSPRHDPGKMA